MICTLHQADCWGVKSDMVGSFNLPDPNLHSTPCPFAAYPPCGAPPPHTSFFSHGNTHTHALLENKKIKQVLPPELCSSPTWPSEENFPLHKPGTAFLMWLLTQCHQLKWKHRVEYVMCCLFSTTTTHLSSECKDNYLFEAVPCDPACMHMPEFWSGNFKSKDLTCF